MPVIREGGPWGGVKEMGDTLGKAVSVGRGLLGTRSS